MARAPDARQVAERVLCLAVVCSTAGVALDLDEAAADADGALDVVRDLREWSAREGLDKKFAASERSLLSKDPAAWTRQEMVDATWRQEAIGVLLWSLDHDVTIPPYDTEFRDVADAVDVLGPTRPFVEGSRLRPRDEIARERDVAELWHWRSRTTQLQTEPQHVDVRREHDLDEIIRSAAMLAHTSADIPEPIDGDFAAFEKPYRDLSEDEYARATSIAVERHYALNWLCGYSADWDEITTDT